MLGVVIGHGSYDGTHNVQVAVPKAVQRLDFFTDEGSPLLMVNLLELLKANNPRRAMESVTTGKPVTNYVYKPFEPHELEAITTLNGLQLPQAQMLVVGTQATPNPIHLCADPDKCKTAGTHVCDGVLGLAVKAHWTEVLILSCRIDTSRKVETTVDLMDATGNRTRAVHDSFIQWGENFLSMTHAAQDAAWTAMTPNEQIYRTAISIDILEWRACHDARTLIDAAGQNKATVAAGLLPKTKVLLMRDYPEYRTLLATNVVLNGQDKQDIAAFKQLPVGDQIDEWIELTGKDPSKQARWMTDPEITQVAAALNVLEQFGWGLVGRPLANVIHKLEPAARKIVMNEEPIQDALRGVDPSLLP